MMRECEIEMFTRETLAMALYLAKLLISDTNYRCAFLTIALYHAVKMHHLKMLCNLHQGAMKVQYKFQITAYSRCMTCMVTL